MYRRNSFIKELVRVDITKGYKPADVIGSVRGVGRPERSAKLNSAGGKYLTRQDATNSGKQWRLANPNALFVSHDAKDNRSIQVREAFVKLDELGWVSAPISAVSLDGVVGHGIVFALPSRLVTLAQCGHLSLMDSTHKTNQLEWKLFTLMVRDKFTCWHPVAHALLSNEFGELIAEFLLAIKKWTPGWDCRYALTDDSGAEIRAFRLAFLGLAAGETEVSHVKITLFLI